MNHDASVARSLLPLLHKLQQDDDRGLGERESLSVGPAMVSEVSHKPGLRAPLVVGQGEVADGDFTVGGVGADCFDGERAVALLASLRREVLGAVLEDR